MEREACTFCRIIGGREPAVFRHRDDRAVVFLNRLQWVPVMLLVVPTEHMSQAELWASGDLMAHVARLAVEMGERYCPGGFRLLSNFGHDAMQTQPHAHVHVLGGAHLGLYLQGPDVPYLGYG